MKGGKRYRICQDIAKQTTSVITSDSIVSVNKTIRDNRNVWILDISDKLNLSKGTAHTIIHQQLQYCKKEDPIFLEFIVAGDESWYHHYRHNSPHPPKKQVCKPQHIISSTKEIEKDENFIEKEVDHS
ncbi:hypothetical protein TNIN_15741 [Trichonephila inaurata madagascariensis]|uniref:Uncharacterized protein n=1 Tax=Trichonephila inaurata madagascariensis TaxID=2747483 RepID=A0A8X6K1B7_9ARAC|nr:hypothetical protein TNIN_15741 [Trichonephila inaurata madagascariensis]